MNAVKKKIPEAVVSGCYFHFSKAVWKKAKEMKICTNENRRHIVRLCASLHLLPEQHIDACWLKIKFGMKKDHEMKEFQAYFEKQWLSLGADTISCGNHEHRRSNNALEGWNRRLNVRMPYKPTLIRFIFI